MFSHCSISERVLPAEQDHQHIFAKCLKRKLESGGRNGFVSLEDHEMCVEEKEHSLVGEKRPRFSEQFTGDQPETEINSQRISKNGELNYFQANGNADVSSTVALNGNTMGTDSLLQNNLGRTVSSEQEEATGMDVECEMESKLNCCPPNLNIGTNTVDQSTPCGSTENSPAKGSPAREFLQRYRPEYQMHCIPSYCHPGGLWDHMLEVYHGL